MTISGFSYIRNGFKYQYPFLQSIQSLLLLCDEVVVAVGQSEDGTREAIADLQKNNPQLHIIDTVWDEQLRQSGKVFAQQANIALRACTGDWVFNLQADELVHENDIPLIKKTIAEIHNDLNINGLLLDFLHFHGNYQHLDASRWRHPREIRAFRNQQQIFSYKDSQGFRQYPSWEAYNEGHKGLKIRVKHLPISVYHYSYVRPATAMQAKAQYFETFWHDDQTVAEKYAAAENQFNYYDIDKVKKFAGSHPALMQDITQNQNMPFEPKQIRGLNTTKLKFIYWLENLIGKRIGEYKNYKL